MSNSLEVDQHLEYSTVQSSTVQYITVQYSTVVVVVVVVVVFIFSRISKMFLIISDMRYMDRHILLVTSTELKTM